MKPLNGEKTHPLSEHARSELARVARAPLPCNALNPGVGNHLLREALVREVMRPSPYKSHFGKRIAHYEVTDAGRAVLRAAPPAPQQGADTSPRPEVFRAKTQEMATQETKLTRSAYRAIARYGQETCRDAFRMHERDGQGAHAVAFQLRLRTTRAADAAINAGRELQRLYGADAGAPPTTQHEDPPVTTYSLDQLYALWDELGDVPVSDEATEGHAADSITTPFLHFAAGTPREDIWRWFEYQDPRFIVGEVQAGIRQSAAPARPGG